ncbi:MAG: hypothetical protein M5U19_09190 [Microthrixaceae bacterium]|nr:hypothetical protein [Microthrixaceae bacterium]
MDRITTEQLEAIGLLEDVLTSPELAELVEMTVRSPAPQEFRAAAVDGSVTFRRNAVAGTWNYEVIDVSGRNPLGDQASDRFLGHLSERDSIFPDTGPELIPACL